jgi:hypothetical protein
MVPYLFLGAVGVLTVDGALADPIGLVVQQQYLGAIGMLPGSSQPELLDYERIVQTNETIQTVDGGTALKFVDQTHLSVSSHSTVVLDRFVYDPDTSNRDSAIKLVKGILRLTSGKLPHQGDLSINTPIAVLTIRGTDVIVDVSDDGTTKVDLLEGAVEIKTCNLTPKMIYGGQKAVILPKCTITLSGPDMTRGNVSVGSAGNPASGPDPGGVPGGSSGGSTGGGHTNRSGGGDGTNPGGHGNSGGANNPGNGGG